jgi:RNA polymerase sigma-70 factor (ECF subfamily)
MTTAGRERLEILSDEQLVALSQEGDLEAFNSLASRWESSLYGLARRSLGNAEDARDVCQEALVKAYVNIKRLRERSKFKSWVHHIVFNICRDRFRSAQGMAEMRTYEEGGPHEMEVVNVRAHASAPDHHATKAHVRGILGDALRRLPVEQRTCILLREYHGFTSEEIGDITGVPAATVRTRIYYGLRAMRKTLRARGITESDQL